VRRSDQYHALDPATGTQLWSVQGLGSATTYSPGGVLATRGEFILYGNGVIEALNASSRAVIWHHDSTATIAEATMAPGGSLVYAVVLDGAQDGTMAVAAAGPGASAQALVAFDVQEGAVRWTFQPGGQGLFTYPGAPGLHTARGMLYVTLCMSPSSATHAGAGSSPCGSQVLYGLNATSGSVAWKFAAGQVSAVQVSQDGSAVVFQTSSSLWDNLKARLQG
jgi:outer membrane protein assembly factor BamB